jgi:hypothetical protein
LPDEELDEVLHELFLDAVNDGVFRNESMGGLNPDEAAKMGREVLHKSFAGGPLVFIENNEGKVLFAK